jgi:hypothetical protein
MPNWAVGVGLGVGEAVGGGLVLGLADGVGGEVGVGAAVGWLVGFGEGVSGAGGAGATVATWVGLAAGVGVGVGVGAVVGATARGMGWQPTTSISTRDGTVPGSMRVTRIGPSVRPIDRRDC